MMVANTTRFGEIQYEAEDIIEIVGGMVGIPGMTRFVLAQHKEGSPFRWMQSLDEPSLAFLVVNPGDITADYAPTIGDKDAESLSLTANDPLLVYLVVTIPPGNPEGMTVNLAGPIIINPANNMGRQVIVEDSFYGTKHSVLEQMKTLAQPAA